MAASFLRKMGVDAADLDDVCQDVFVQVFRYLGRFQHRSQLTTWLYKICLSQVSRMRRRHKVTQALGRLFGTREASAVQASVDLPEDEELGASERPSPSPFSPRRTGRCSCSTSCRG